MAVFLKKQSLAFLSYRRKGNGASAVPKHSFTVDRRYGATKRVQISEYLRPDKIVAQKSPIRQCTSVAHVMALTHRLGAVETADGEDHRAAF